MNAKLIHKGEQPMFNINGKDYPPIAFMSYVPNAERNMRFREDGMKLFSCTLFFGDLGIYPDIGLKPFSKGFWRGYGEYDFSDCDRLLETLVPDGKGAFIFPRIFIDAPRWWYELNPNETCRNSSGQRYLQSYASRKWREDASVALRALIDHISSSKWAECVFAYHVAFGGTEECTYQNMQHLEATYADTSEHSLALYREWLERKYRKVEALQKEWAQVPGVDKIKSFDCVELPKTYEVFCSHGGLFRDASEAHVVDFLKFRCFLLADTLEYFCKVIKDYTENSLICGGFFGYIIHFGDLLRAHNDCYDLFSSPYIDFVSTAGGTYTMALPSSSLSLHGKLWFAEGDIRTNLSNLLSEAMPEVLPPHNSRYADVSIWKGPDTAEGGISALRRGGANALTRKSGIWYFDMWGGWFDSPELMREISAIREATEKQAKSDRSLPVRVALIVDESGQFGYGDLRSDEIAALVNDLPAELRTSGLAYHVYLADDLADIRFDPEDYDLYFMVGFASPSERVKRGVERLKGGDRALIWMHTAELEDSSLCDFTLVYDKTQPRIRSHRVSSLGAGVSYTFPEKFMRAARFSRKDTDESYVLGHIINEGEAIASAEPSILLKRCDGYTSIFCLSPTMPSRLIGELATILGVFAYADAGDAVMVGGSYVGIYSQTGGEKRIFLPERVRGVFDAISGEEQVTNEGLNIPLALKPGETRLFYIE